MKRNSAKSPDSTDLRRLAEQRLKQRPEHPDLPRTTAEIQRLVHELQIHQVELEMQNEELRNAQVEIEEGLARYIDLYDFAPVGYLTLDRGGTILQINLSGTRMLSSDRSHLVGRRFDLRLAVADRPAFNTFLAHLFAGQPNPFCEAALALENNAPRHVRIEALLSQDQQSARLAVTDITDRKQAEEQHKQALAAEAASRAKDQFIAALSHELRTPLTPVLLALSVIDTDPALPPHLHDHLVLVRRNLDLEIRLIDDLLDLNRIARGKIQLQIRFVDLHDRLRNVIDICRHEALAKHLNLQTDLRAAQHHLDGDPARLQQIFWNLLRNAVKFTPDGGTITVQTSNPRPGLIRVDFTDTGIGLKPDALARIFTPFEQANPQVTSHFGGLGLGLAICKNLTELHHGNIYAFSQGEGLGATFTLELPAATHPAPAPADAPSSQPPPPVRPMRILLVEDQPDTRRMLERLLKSAGHKITSALSVTSALQAAADADGNFDLVLSDLGLPDGSGLDLMRTLRDRWKLRGIAISGYGMDEDKARSRAAGFIDHLTKPIQIEVLEEALARFQSLPPST